VQLETTFYQRRQRAKGDRGKALRVKQTREERLLLEEHI